MQGLIGFRVFPSVITEHRGNACLQMKKDVFPEATPNSNITIFNLIPKAS